MDITNITVPNAKFDDEEFDDAMELQNIEEQNRLCDLSDDYDEFLPAFQNREPNFATGIISLKPSDYILTVKGIEDEISSKIQLKKRLYQGEFLLENGVVHQQKKLVRLQNILKIISKTEMREPIQTESIHNLSLLERCRLYRHWKEALRAVINTQLIPLEKKFNELSAKIDEMKMARYLYVARQADVVGMTTTGASQYHSMIQDLGPKIVIIEEAAEILEAHVVTSLASSVEHLIMIGDHQQLKPSSAVHQLAKHYNLDVSLFERMINNDLAFQTLQHQHRMRPEISALLVPTIYKDLKDHKSVEGRPNIKGITKNVFFLKHEKMEVSQSDDNNSHSNEFEASLIIQLARHLVLQGYTTDQITILTPYSGQFFLLRKEMRKFASI